MNAIVALCHFCEAHGPCPIFCTHTLRDTRIDKLINNNDTVEIECPGCNSIGKSVGMLSQDSESNANFLSTQAVVITDTAPLVKQAAVRSLSCEVSGNNDGNLVYFGDAFRGHVLSYTFQIHDSQARGFFRLFSMIVLMKDKMYLLNIQPFLAEHLQKVSTELQTYSAGVHSAEQAKYSERAQRINSGQASTQPPRSLIELTGRPNIFAYIHSHFAWILWMGVRYLVENIAIGLPSVPPWSDNQNDCYSIIHLNSQSNQRCLDNVQETENCDFFRKCAQALNEHFVAVCYCVVIGVQVVLRGPPTKTSEFVRCFASLLPQSMQYLVMSDQHEYLPSSKCRILSVLPHVAVPQPSSSVYRIEFVTNSNEVHVKWLGTLPCKYPDLLNKVMKAVNEKLFTDSVLQKQVRFLVEEWKNKVLCLQPISSNQDIVKLKNVLGIQSHDQLLLNYWSVSMPQN